VWQEWFHVKALQISLYAKTLLPALQATKEAEYRDKVADLKARIDSCTARRNAEQEHEATAKVNHRLCLQCCPDDCCMHMLFALTDAISSLHHLNLKGGQAGQVAMLSYKLY
jgi:hypothetical protein